MRECDCSLPASACATCGNRDIPIGNDGELIIYDEASTIPPEVYDNLLDSILAAQKVLDEQPVPVVDRIWYCRGQWHSTNRMFFSNKDSGLNFDIS